MKTKLFPVALASLTLLAMAGCSRSNGDDAKAAVATQPPAATAAPPTTAPPASTAAPAASPADFAAKVGDSALGKLMTDAKGLTLYGFTNDINATSTCYSTCAEAWPPVIVAADWKVGPGLDTGVFSTTKRDDGSLQLVAGKYPLYTYGGDAAPGDTTGHGSGDVWFAVNLDGTLVSADAAAAPTTTAAAPAATPAPNPYGNETGTTVPAAAPAPDAAPTPVSTATTPLGEVLVDTKGMTLYGFTKDADGNSSCNDKCAEAWPPLTVDSADLPAGLDPQVFSVITRADGSHQLKAGKWPLYRFAGDSAPGDVNGQGSGGSWFVVDPTGKLIK
jgi:predicted lipoprotein with Yx(FWY)xxD motif